MKALALLAGCALLGWWLVREIQRAERERAVREAAEEQQRAVQGGATEAMLRENQRRFLQQLGLSPPKPRVVESQYGVFVRASSPEEAAEIVSQSQAFRSVA